MLLSHFNTKFNKIRWNSFTDYFQLLFNNSLLLGSNIKCKRLSRWPQFARIHIRPSSFRSEQIRSNRKSLPSRLYCPFTDVWDLLRDVWPSRLYKEFFPAPFWPCVSSSKTYARSEFELSLIRRATCIDNIFASIPHYLYLNKNPV